MGKSFFRFFSGILKLQENQVNSTSLGNPNEDPKKSQEIHRNPTEDQMA